VAVSKAQPASAIAMLAELGQADFGENYLQEALPKIAELTPRRLTWHFIGQIQANKTRAIAEHFAWAHTVDRERVAARLNEQRPHYAPPLNICIQVLLAPEAAKGGVPPSEVGALARSIRTMPHLRLRGLMCVPPHEENYDAQLVWFRQLRALYDELNADGLGLDTLSMGMSADLEAAVAAGATLVRIGTAVFGERKK
jgi:pyridoxal phosphate enzyme (YggS family)